MKTTDEFGNSERDIRMVAIAAHTRGDYEAERLALDRLALMERAATPELPPTCGQPAWHHDLFYCGRGCPWWAGEDDDGSVREMEQR